MPTSTYTSEVQQIWAAILEIVGDDPEIAIERQTVQALAFARGVKPVNFSTLFADLQTIGGKRSRDELRGVIAPLRRHEGINYLTTKGVERWAASEVSGTPEGLASGGQRRWAFVLRILRPGAPAFRRRLAEAYGRTCAITPCAVFDALDGAHIRPYDGPPSDVMTNGLLLRLDVHRLFDRHLLGIDSGGLVRVHPSIGVSYQDLDGQPLRAPLEAEDRPDPAALAEHYQEFSKGLAAP